MTALVVLGMHRSGTSCLAGMLCATGAVAAGATLRNWDNARGHFESLATVRLNEAVLARSGGHWLEVPARVRWTEEQAQERDRLLGQSIEGRAPLLKDPRTLPCLAFWRASALPFRSLGIVRHPLAVARSLASWRGLPLELGLELWTAHNRILAADQELHGYPLLDFEQPVAAFREALVSACERLGLSLEGAARRTAFEEAYEERLVHHDGADASGLAGLEEAAALYRTLARRAGSRDEGPVRRPHPRTALEAFEQRLAAGDGEGALDAALAALEAAADPAAVAVPVVAALLRVRARGAAEAFLAHADTVLEPALARLLTGKVHLAFGDARAALPHLVAACAVPEPLHQARRLLPLALRQAGRKAEAREALRTLAAHALYPHGPLAWLAEWTRSDGDPRAALERMRAAIEAAPPHRRGRLRTRHATWLVELGEPDGARAELRLALEEDPTYPRARLALERLEADPHRVEGR